MKELSILVFQDCPTFPYLYGVRDNPHQILMEQAFSKVSARLQEHRSGIVTKSDCAKALSDFISSNTDHAISEASVEAYWDTVESGISFHIPEIQVLNGLAQYLDFPNYETWQVAQEVRTIEAAKDPRRKWIKIIIIGLIVLLSMIVYQLITYPW